jgi:hypothetical protein
MAGNGRNPGGPKLPPAAFLAALAGGSTIKEAAEIVGKSERTAYRWLQDPAVQRAVSRLRSDLTASALGLLCQEMRDSVRELVKLRGEDGLNIRLQAANSILSLGLKYLNTVDLESRLAEVERRLGMGPPADPTGEEQPL